MEKNAISTVINKKRVRSTNFSFIEKELLLKFALQKKKILENKESNAVSWNDKNIAWVGIAEKFNAATPGCVRNIFYKIYCNFVNFNQPLLCITFFLSSFDTL
uniref:Regulatory protein zeste n=1 Tax=Schizaphis graminum TaxID=13262 RepID=A0A2S2PIU3_SCHGA